VSYEPFGRQPKPVTVTINGDPADVSFWLALLAGKAEFRGDQVTREIGAKTFGVGRFTIYPRAVNE
jgi:hypothetical protein